LTAKALIYRRQQNSPACHERGVETTFKAARTNIVM